MIVCYVVCFWCMVLANTVTEWSKISLASLTSKPIEKGGKLSTSYVAQFLVPVRFGATFV